MSDLLTDEHATLIVRLMHRIGVDPESTSMRDAQRRSGGLPTPYGYLLMTDEQATTMIGLMLAFLRDTNRDSPEWEVVA